MTNLEIYEQTQDIAKIIAAGNGYIPMKEGDSSVFNHLSKNPRNTGFFSTAVAIQELINQHEMGDVLDDVEESLLDKYHGEASAHDLAKKIAICHHAALIINKAMIEIKKQELFLSKAFS